MPIKKANHDFGLCPSKDKSLVFALRL